MSKLDGSLDTNALLRLLLKDNASQAKRVEDLIANSDQPLYVSLLCIAEVVYVFEGMGFSREVIHRNLETLATIDDLRIQADIILPAAAFYADHPAVSFVDACLVFEAEVLEAAPLYTFDKKLYRQAHSAESII